MSTSTIQQPSPPAPAARPGRGPGATALLWVGGVVAVLAIAQVAVQAADRLSSSETITEHSYDVTRVVELTADGDVSVSVGGTDSIDVQERSHDGFIESRYDARQFGDRLTVEHRCGRWGWVSLSCSADLAVRVPAGTEVVVRVTDGDVSADGIAGKLDLHVGDGDVTVLDAGGAVLARAGSGSVEVTGAAGDVEARSSDGDVTVLDVRGSVEARTSSGGVEVEQADGDVHAETSDGDVQVRTVGGDALARTSSGSVRVAAVDGDVEARSSDGDVTVWGTGTPVALEISTSDGSTTVEAPTDPQARRTVLVRTSSGNVSYLNAE